MIASTRGDFAQQISPDGKKIAFQSGRSGSYQIWLCDSDGQNLTQLTSVSGPFGAGTPRWSPDGRQIAFDVHAKGSGDVYVMDVEGGFPRPITAEPSEDVVPSWSRDGRWIYFASDRSGSFQVWKAPADGGRPVQVTKQGGFSAFESPDGKFVYYGRGLTTSGIWRVAAAGGEEIKVIDAPKAGYWGDWAIVDDGIYFIDWEATTGANIEFFSFATQQTKQVADLGKERVSVEGFAVSPDRRWLLYTQMEDSSDIMLVENFH